jgi:hypothetical protein
MLKHLIKRTPVYLVLDSLRTNLRQKYQIRKWRSEGYSIPPPPAVKHSIIIEYANKFRTDVLVETGTCFGDTIAATKRYFQRVYSIELSPVLHEQAKLRFSEDPKITLLLGDSGTVLKDVLREIKTRPLFWLDAHYSGGSTARGVVKTPIVQELNVILSHCPSSVVLIDDARMFNGEESYPTVAELRRQVAERAPGWCMEIKHDIIRLWGTP